MSPTKLKRQLREVMKTWQLELRNPDIEGLEGYMPGVLKGLQEALRIVEKSHEQDLRKFCGERRRLSQWSAVDLYRACQSAYGRLVYSDRSGAMRALKKALDKNRS